jgi:iron complex transport system substrate-binding protein
VVGLVIAAAWITSVLGRSWLPAGGVRKVSGKVTNRHRIVSLAPSITEVLYAVGCGKRVRGVTRYCKYPPAARKKPRVGGYIDPSLEAIVALRPDLVLALANAEHRRARGWLRRTGLPVMIVDHRRLGSIVASARQLGRACGRPRKGRALAARLQRRIDRVRARVQGQPRPRVLIVFGRSPCPGVIKDLYVAGRSSLYDEIIRLAGGRNAFRRPVPAYPKLSVEGLTLLDPEVIIELVPNLGKPGRRPGDVLPDWRRLASLRAVRRDHVVLLDAASGEIPGPRIVDLLEDVARAVHPERFGRSR